MAIAIKTYLHTSGLNRLSKMMMHGKKGFVIPKERWVKKNGRYYKHYDINPDCIPENFSLWNKEPITEIYSFETCMIDVSWAKKMKKRGVKIYDVPMIEWVERNKFLRGDYKIFDKIICLNDFAYEIFSSKYDKVTRESFFMSPSEDHFYNKENTIYHQASCSASNPNKNTDLVIDCFKEMNLKNYKLVITGILNEFQKNKINDANIDYKGVVSYCEVLDTFKTSKIYLSPSSQEGLSIPLYEARKYGCKVVTTNFSPMKEVGDYLCDIEFVSEGDRFMYPKLKVIKESIKQRLYEAINNSL